MAPVGVIRVQAAAGARYDTPEGTNKDNGAAIYWGTVKLYAALVFRYFVCIAHACACTSPTTRKRLTSGEREDHADDISFIGAERARMSSRHVSYFPILYDPDEGRGVAAFFPIQPGPIAGENRCFPVASRAKPARDAPSVRCFDSFDAKDPVVEFIQRLTTRGIERAKGRKVKETTPAQFTK